MRVATLKRYGIDDAARRAVPRQGRARGRDHAKRARAWAKVFDGNSLVALRKARVRFDAEKDLAKIKAKVLYVLSRTDKLFPPSIAPDVMAKLKAAGVTADYFEIDSDFGHLGLGPRRRQVGAAAQDLHGRAGEAELAREELNFVRRRLPARPECRESHKSSTRAVDRLDADGIKAFSGQSSLVPPKPPPP